MSDPISSAAYAISSSRSFSRCRFLVTIDDHGGSMSENRLARACGWDVYRLRSVAFGDEGENKSFSIERSPFALGQVTCFETPHGRVYVLTNEGREEVRQLRAEAFWARGRLRKPLG